MSFHSRIAFSLLTLLVVSGRRHCSSPGLTARPAYLNQGWSDIQRQQFYTTTQGSQLIPLAWFLALERPGSEDLFVSDHLSRFGFLPNAKSPRIRMDSRWVSRKIQATEDGQVNLFSMPHRPS